MTQTRLRRNDFAVISLILAVVALFSVVLFAPVITGAGLIFGFLALGKARDGECKYGVTWLALIINGLLLLIVISS